ncbi:MAG: sporulation integral membrane protein YtvI [Clostridia bacterium]|nr:sporulation integral membrane protein YtvI [Clostridia bacterium]
MFEKSNINFKKILMLLLTVLGVIAGLFVAFKLSIFLAPFVIALIVSSLMEPIINFLTTKLRIPRRLAAAVTLLVFLGAFGSVIFLLVSRLITEIKDIYVMFPKYFTQVYDEVMVLINRALDIYHGLPKDVTYNIESFTAELPSKFNMEGITENVSKSVMGILKGISNIPQVLIFILVTILSTYFLASDRELVYGSIKSQLPDSWVGKLTSIKNDMFYAFFGYIKAQLILMTITFTELLIGFSIIGINYTILLAFLISIIDALPILGTGSVLIPWALYNFITGDIQMGLSLVILYGIVLVVRQMIEPKVLGQQIGIHPLLTLLAMYTGLNLLGVLGLILGPITLLLLKNVFLGILKGRSLKELIMKS